MVCFKCGAQLPEGSVFCTNCGSNVAIQAQAQQSQMQQQQMQQQQMQQQQMMQQQMMQQQKMQERMMKQQMKMQQAVMQPKAKAGMAVGLLAAGMAFLGMLNTTALVLVALYVFLKEEDNWLRKAAVRIVGTVVMFAAFTGLMNVGFNFLRMIDTTIELGFSGFYILNKIITVENILFYIIDGIQTILLFIIGIKALSMKAVRIPIVDGLIDKYMNK